MLINKIILFILISIFSSNVFSEEILDKTLYKKPYANNELKSGQYFSKKETRSMEIEEFENPGMIWVERGKELFDNKISHSIVGFPLLSKISLAFISLILDIFYKEYCNDFI